LVADLRRRRGRLRNRLRRRRGRGGRGGRGGPPPPPRRPPPPPAPPRPSPRAASSQLGTCSTVRSSGSVAGVSGSDSCAGGCSVPPCSAWRCAASVARKSSASGPSRMLARRRAIEHLLGEIAVHVRSLSARVVLQHRLSLHGRL